MSAIRKVSGLLVRSKNTTRNIVCRRNILFLRHDDTVVHPPMVYRTAPPEPSKKVSAWATALGAFMWYWIMWHMWHEPEHIYGHWLMPDASKWTDAELGIPPDDED